MLRLPPHLKLHHKLDPKSDVFNALLARARSLQRKQRNENTTLPKPGNDNTTLKKGIEGNALQEMEQETHGVSTNSHYRSDVQSCQHDISDMQGDVYEIEVADGDVRDHHDVATVQDNQCDIDSKNAKGHTIGVYSAFSKWLQSCDGGRKNIKSAQQHAFQAFTIVQCLDGIMKESELSNADFLCKQSIKLLDKDLLRNKFLNEYVLRKKFEPGTVKSYLSSIRHFYHFCLSEARMDTAEKMHIEEMNKCVARWICFYPKESLRRSLQKKHDDIDKLITPEQVKLFE